MDFLQIQHLTNSIGGSVILKDVNLKFEQGQRISIAGQTGSGKTTLLRLIAGLIQPGDGTVFFKGEKVKGPQEQLIPGHPRIAYLSQYFELRNHYRVSEELDYANKLSLEHAEQIFEICRIGHLLQRYTHQLSGGERQRIAMAKLLLSGPELLLLDEPFSNLDQHHLKWMQEIIEKVGKDMGMTVILVDHEPDHILPWAQRIIVLKDGEITQEGTPEGIYRNPVNAYVAGLFGRFSIMPDRWKAGTDRGKFLVCRPEQLTFYKREAAGEGIKGEVVDVRYYGSHNEVEVNVGETELLVRVAVNASVKRKLVTVYPK